MFVIALVAMTAACIGAGAAVLALVGLWRESAALERSSLAFAIGFGLLGWLVFWMGVFGWLDPAWIWSILICLALGNVLHWLPGQSVVASPASRLDLLLKALIAGTALLYATEAIAPPIDADTLAYHFDLAKRFVEAGRLTFVPWALSGAIPLMVQMTYTAIYALAGETGLTGWTFVTSLMSAVLLFAFGRQFLSLTWSLAITLLYLTTPAMIYSSGAGHVEPRIALFALTTAMGLVVCARSPRMAPAAVAGMAAGFYAASKLTGLLFAVAGMVAVISTREPRFRRAAVYGIVAAIFGGQWYVWNSIHTGDPFFPLLFNLADRLGLANHAYWNSDYAAYFKAYLGGRAEPVAAWHWILSFPVVATLFPPPEFESGRVGLGPFALMIVPFSLWGLWRACARVRESGLFPVAVLVVLFYLLWIEFGGIPKVRHLLALYPIILVCIVTAAIRYASGQLISRSIGAAVALSLSVNFAALSLFISPYVVFTATNTSRDDFLLQRLSGYSVIHLVNEQADITRILVWDRQLQFYINARTFFASPHAQSMIDARPGLVRPAMLYSQLNEQEISHLLLRKFEQGGSDTDLHGAAKTLSEHGCLAYIGSADANYYSSRTLKALSTMQASLILWRVVPNCGYKQARD